MCGRVELDCACVGEGWNCIMCGTGGLGVELDCMDVGGVELDCMDVGGVELNCVCLWEGWNYTVWMWEGWN